MRFKSALNNMNQGLCMFDAEGRVVVSVARYLDIYSIDSARVRLGCTLHRRAGRAKPPAPSWTIPIDMPISCAPRIKHGESFTINTELAEAASSPLSTSLRRTRLDRDP